MVDWVCAGEYVYIPDTKLNRFDLGDEDIGKMGQVSGLSWDGDTDVMDISFITVDGEEITVDMRHLEKTTRKEYARQLIKWWRDKEKGQIELRDGHVWWKPPDERAFGKEQWTLERGLIPAMPITVGGKDTDGWCPLLMGWFLEYKNDIKEILREEDEPGKQESRDGKDGEAFGDQGQVPWRRRGFRTQEEQAEKE